MTLTLVTSVSFNIIFIGRNIFSHNIISILEMVKYDYTKTLSKFVVQ